MIHLGEEVSRKLSEMENKDEILARLREDLARAAQEYIYGTKGTQPGTLGGGLPRTSGAVPVGPGAQSETEKPPATR